MCVHLKSYYGRSNSDAILLIKEIKLKRHTPEGAVDSSYKNNSNQ